MISPMRWAICRTVCCRDKEHVTLTTNNIYVTFYSIFFRLFGCCFILLQIFLYVRVYALYRFWSETNQSFAICSMPPSTWRRSTGVTNPVFVWYTLIDYDGDKWCVNLEINSIYILCLCSVFVCRENVTINITPICLSPRVCCGGFVVVGDIQFHFCSTFGVVFRVNGQCSW